MRPTLPALTSLRFFAALFVVLFHFHLTRTDLPALSLFNFGYPAVTFFFILSGFILTYSHSTLTGMNLSVSEFFVSRASRLVPAYYFALLISLPIFLVKGPLISAPFVLSMTQAWLPSYVLAWNSPAWSLSNEMFFYLCFPAILISTRRLPALPLLIVAAALVVGMALCREVIFKADEWDAFRSYFPLFNLPQFVLGMALGKYYLAVDRRPGVMLFLAGVVTFGSILILLSEIPWLSNTAILSLAFSAIILGACRPIPMLGSRPLLILGEASYSIYILHMPLLSYWTHAVHPERLPWMIDLGLFLLIVLTTSIAAHYLVEKPGRRRVKSAFIARDYALEPRY